MLHKKWTTKTDSCLIYPSLPGMWCTKLCSWNTRDEPKIQWRCRTGRCITLQKRSCPLVTLAGKASGGPLKLSSVKQSMRNGRSFFAATVSSGSIIRVSSACKDSKVVLRLIYFMAYFHCRTRIQIRTRTRIPNPMATWYYAEHVSTDSDSDLDPFPIVFV